MQGPSSQHETISPEEPPHLQWSLTISPARTISPLMTISPSMTVTPQDHIPVMPISPQQPTPPAAIPPVKGLFSPARTLSYHPADLGTPLSPDAGGAQVTPGASPSTDAAPNPLGRGGVRCLSLALGRLERAGERLDRWTTAMVAPRPAGAQCRSSELAGKRAKFSSSLGASFVPPPRRAGAGGEQPPGPLLCPLPACGRIRDTPAPLPRGASSGYQPLPGVPAVFARAPSCARCSRRCPGVLCPGEGSAPHGPRSVLAAPRLRRWSRPPSPGSLL